MIHSTHKLLNQAQPHQYISSSAFLCGYNYGPQPTNTHKQTSHAKVVNGGQGLVVNVL